MPSHLKSLIYISSPNVTIETIKRAEDRDGIIVLTCLPSAQKPVPLRQESAAIWHAEAFLSHPLLNTATLILEKSELARFFSLTGHTVHFFEGA